MRSVLARSMEDGDKLFWQQSFYAQVKDDIELLQEAGNEFSEEAILAGWINTQSSLVQPDKLWGAGPFLRIFLKFAPEPHGHKKTDGEIQDPYDKDFSDLSLKSKPTWPSSPWPHCLCPYRIRWVWARTMSTAFATKTAKLSNVTQFMAEKVVRMWQTLSQRY